MSAQFAINVSGMRALGRRIEHLVEAGAVIARNAVVEQMEPGPPRTGRTYPIPGTDQTYTASAPGQPPAVREGRYVASWKNSPAVRDADVIRARAYTDLKVGAGEAAQLGGVGEHVLGDLLENGTSRMAPRPHVRPALEIARAEIAQLITNASS